MRSPIEVLLSTTVLFAALLLLRHEMLATVAVDYATAWQIGIDRGVLQDLCVSLLPGVAAALVAAFSRVGYWLPWALGAVAIWGLALANLLFFQYFGAPLEAWTIAEHVGDVWIIRGVVGDMLRPALLGPGALILLGCVWAARRGSPPTGSVRAARLRTAAVTAALAASAAFGAVGLAPAERLAGSVIAENVAFEIARDALRVDAPGPAHHAALQRFGLRGVVRLEPRFGGAPTAHLAALRDGRGWQPKRSGDRAGDAFSSLLRPLAVDPARTAAMRERLGLDPDRTPNIIVLFLESTRAYEVQHPEIGPSLFPELRGVLERHAISFTTAYSSAMAAGLTARGQFSTNCSMLPNFGGAATFIAHPEVRVRCMADVAREAGFETLWISGGPMHFHNKFTFERLHGTRTFFDEAYFEREPAERPYEGCGFPDKALLERSVALLERAKRPFYASILTISTHVPHSLVPEAPVPSELEALFREHGNGLDSQQGEKYAAYLSRLRYLDQSVGVFFRAFFASDLADHTVVVVLGDHGVGVQGALPVTAAQRIEQRARIPLALVSAGIKRGESLTHQVHQIDVAPTVAEIAGWTGDVTWLGRSLMQGGTPWVFASDSELHYRVGDRACYAEPGTAQRCYELAPGDDPLFDTPARSVPAERTHEMFFLGLALETRQAITRNQLAARAQ